MKQTIYNATTGQCSTNHSKDPWGELRAINDMARIAHAIEAYTMLNKKQNVRREDLCRW